MTALAWEIREGDVLDALRDMPDEYRHTIRPTVLCFGYAIV